MYLPLLLLSFLGLSTNIHAQAQDLISELQQAGLTTFASALERANRSDTGQKLVAALTDGSQKYTVFAPDNAAFQAPATAALSDNPADIANLLSYHVLRGSYANSSSNNASLSSAFFPLVTGGRTLLTDPSLVNLEGGKGQVIVWSRNDTNSSVYFLNQSPRVTLRNSSTQGNLFIGVISGVLLPPRRLGQVLDVNDINSFADVLGSVRANFYGNETSETFLEALEANNTKGFTLFAPTDLALRNAGNQLNDLKSNETALVALLGNHYVNGTSYYSPTLLQSSSSTSYISESGQSFSLSSNSSGVYVTVGNVFAKIVRSDVLVKNGVVHVIDTVLVDTAHDEAKADAAYKSYTSIAAQPTTETGPIGPIATSSPGGGSGSGGNNGKSNSAGHTFSLGLMGAAGVGAIGWLAFSWLA